MLIQNLHKKDTRKTMITQRKNAQIETIQRANNDIQALVFRTAATTTSIGNPMPFEQYKKEFDAIKVQKKEANPDET